MIVVTAWPKREALLTMARYTPDSLKEFTAAALTAAGSDPAEAVVVANNLIGANLRGIDSHGLVRLPVYVERMRRGVIDTPAHVTIARQMPAAALLDGGNGWGAVVGRQGMEMAISMAAANGVGVVTVVNSNHFGYAAHYGEMALARDMIAIVTTNATPLMIPTGGREVALGTNPICICAPAGQEPPFVFDGATTVVARGKITVAAKKGLRIPTNWGVDAQGHPTDDPAAVTGLSPLGGYKGYDLAVAVDILSGVLGGGPFGQYIGVLGAAEGPQRVGHFFLALNIEAFRDIAGFKQDMDKMLRELRANPAAAGSHGVLIAGDPERSEHAARRSSGVPVPAEIEADMARLADEYKLTMPVPLA